MKSILSLQQDRAHKLRCAQDVLDRAEKENRALNTDEIGVFDKATAEVDALDAEIKGLEETLKRQEALNATRQKLEQGDRKVTPSPVATPTYTPSMTIPATAKRSGILKAFKGPNAEEKAYASGMWARAIIFQDDHAARWCEGHLPNFRNAISEGGNAGVLVPEEFTQTLIDLREQYGIFRQNAMNWPMKSDTALIPRRTGGLTVYFIGENPSAAPTESDPTWNQVRLTAKKAAGLTRMSTEISEDAVIDLADWLAQEAAYAMALKEDQCGFTGDGTSTYGGIRGITDILKAGQSLAGAVDAAAGHDTFAEIDATDLSTLMAKLPGYARMNAKWYVSTVGFDLVFGRLMQAGGGNTITDLSAGYSPRYLGYPIVISQVLPSVTTDLSDVAMLLFGDLRLSSVMGTRREIRVFPSEHRYMELDQIGVFFSERFDIVNHSYGDATTAGPIVALVGE